MKFGNAQVSFENTTTQFQLIIRNYTELKPYLSKSLYSNGKVNETAGKLLECLIIRLTEQGFTKPSTVLKLTEYSEMISQTDIKGLREKTNCDLKVLNKIHITYQNTKGKYITADLCKCSGNVENGQIYFELNDAIYKELCSRKSAFFRYIPLSVFNSNAKKNPHQYLIYKVILSNSWRNANSIRENKIKVKEIYNYCRTLPRIDKANGQVLKNIKIPFDRDLKSINEFDYNYSSPDYLICTFEEWLNIDIIITWKEQLLGLDILRNKKEKHQDKMEKAKMNALTKIEMENITKSGRVVGNSRYNEKTNN